MNQVHRLRLEEQGTRSAVADRVPRAAAVGFGSKTRWGAVVVVGTAGVGSVAAVGEEIVVSLQPEADMPVFEAALEVEHRTTVVASAVIARMIARTVVVAAVYMSV